MEREVVTSRANPLLTRVRRLNSRRAFRRAEGAFSAEGPKLLAEALRWGGELEAVICVPGSALPELPARTRVVEVEDSLLASIADTESPQGIVFICKGKNLTVPELAVWEAASARLAGREPLSAAGRRTGPGQCGHYLAHRRRLWGGRAHLMRRLCRPLGPQDGAGHHGCGVPSAGV